MAGQYAQLCNTTDIGKVTKAFLGAIELSFVTNPMPSGEVPRTEISRRFRVCDKIFTMLRADLHWSVPKIIDLLPTYLKCELDGVPYNPETVGSSWSTDAVEMRHDVPHLPATVGVSPNDIVADDPVWDSFDPEP